MLYFNLISFLLIIGGAAVLGLQTPAIAASARIYPLVLVVLVIACALIVAAQEIAGRRATAPLDSKYAQILSAPLPQRLRVLAFVVAWLAYAWALTPLGFLVATTGAISVSLWLLRTKNILVAVATAATFSVTLAILFATVLYIPTPMGPLDQLLIRAIYAIQHS